MKVLNGYEGWRRIVREYEPRVASRRLQILLRLLEVNFPSIDHFLVDLLSWERECEVYQKLAGRELDDELKMAMVMMRCPEPLGEHLRLNAETLGNRYETLRSHIENYLHTRVTLSDHHPTEVDAVIGVTTRVRKFCTAQEDEGMAELLCMWWCWTLQARLPQSP